MKHFHNFSLKLKPFIEAVILVNKVFNDPEKVYHWFTTENLNFGGAKPIIFFHDNSYIRILKFIKTQTEDLK